MPGPDDIEEITLSVQNRIEPGGSLSGVRLWTLKLQDGKDFKRDGPKPVLGSPAPAAITRSPVSLDWYPRIEANQSAGVRGSDGDGQAKDEGVIGERQRTFLDFDQIWFELERYKAEKAWFNLAIPRTAPRELLESSDWYRLFIPSNELVFASFERVRTWHEVAVALLKKYCDRFYKLKQSEWEAEFLEYRELKPDNGNFVAEYTFRVPDVETDLKAELDAIASEMAAGKALDHRKGGLTALSFDRHLYTPLISLEATGSELSPGDAKLNKGERDFVEAVRRYHESNPSVLAGKELYLLRNRSRGKGLGFFEAGNFYPDFVLWVVDGARQNLAFVDPKGLRNLEGKTDPKIELAKTIKDRERALGNKNIRLESFLWSETKYAQVQWNRAADQLTVDELEKAHVLFPADDPPAAVGRLLNMLLAPQGSAA